MYYEYIVTGGNMDIFGRLIRMTAIPLDLDDEPRAKCIPVGREMIGAFTQGAEWYKPVLGELPLAEEGGASEPSYKNLCLLIGQFGQPQKIERNEAGNVLVCWPGQTPDDDKFYLATGFEVGYFGTGPYYFARFVEKAGFGDFDDLYMAITGMDRKASVGTLWERK